MLGEIFYIYILYMYDVNNIIYIYYRFIVGFPIGLDFLSS